MSRRIAVNRLNDDKVCAWRNRIENPTKEKKWWELNQFAFTFEIFPHKMSTFASYYRDKKDILVFEEVVQFS